ncbi:hypothetical protein ABIB48_002207 [Arthrobacter sp. UYCu511]
MRPVSVELPPAAACDSKALRISNSSRTLSNRKRSTSNAKLFRISAGSSEETEVPEPARHTYPTGRSRCARRDSVRQDRAKGGRGLVVGERGYLGETMPVSYAMSTTWTRSRAFNFARMCPTCVFTVASDTNS